MMTSSVTAHRPAEILLVEDNAGDVRLTREILEETDLSHNLNVASDGVAAMSYLMREGEYDSAPRPDIIMLDLNLPRKDGREVLPDIKTDPEPRSIPVVIFTTSAAEEDVLTSYDLHANCYISKPIDLEHFIAVVNSIRQFWLNTVTLPSSVS